MSKTSPTQRSLKMLRDAGWTCGVVERWNMHAGIRQDFCGGIDVIAFKGPPRGDPIAYVIAGTVPLPPDLDVGPRTILSASDPISFTPGGEILGVQACAGGDLAAHRTKLLNEPRMREWVAAGGRLTIHAWRKLCVVKKDGSKGKARRWVCNEVELTLSDFSAPAPSASTGTT